MKRVPTLRTPPLGDPPAVEHDVLAARLGEQPAHGETGVPGADHDGVDRVHDDPFGALSMSGRFLSTHGPAGLQVGPAGPVRDGRRSAGDHVDDDGGRVGEGVVHGGATP